MHVVINLAIIIAITLIWAFFCLFNILDGQNDKLAMMGNVSLAALTALAALMCTNYVLVVK